METKKTLADVAIGETFKIGDMEFVKFSERDSETAIISKHSLFEMPFGDSNNYAERDIRARLESEVLPLLEREIGADNIIEHELDLRALDGSDEYGKIRCKISLSTIDFLREHCELYKKEFSDTWTWTATPWSTKKYNWTYSVLCVAPRGFIFNDDCNYCSGVRPFLILNSSIFVS